MPDKKYVQSKASVTYVGEFADLPSLIFELDTEYIKERYGFAKSVFDFTETAYLRLIPALSSASYSLEVSNGSIKRVKTNIPYEYEEDLSFVKTTSEELKYVPIGTVNVEWVTGEKKPVIINGRIVKLSDKTNALGTLRCTYQTYCDRIAVSWVGAPAEDAVTVLALADYRSDTEELSYEDKPDNTVSQEINFKDIGKRDVTITYKDIGTDKIVPDATVILTKLDGSGTILETQTEVTDENGSVTFKALKIGEEYRLKISCTGYIDSDKDYLLNDKFIVPEADEAAE